MAMILGSSSASLFAGKTAAAPVRRSRNVVLAATGSRSKTTKVSKSARQTKKIEVDEETGLTIGALGIFGVAVATAGALIIGGPQKDISGVLDGFAPAEKQEVSAPEPTARNVPLPSADTGSKVKPSDKSEAAAPVAKKEAVKEEKPSIPQAPAYTAPPAIKAEKAGSPFSAPKSAPSVKSSEPASSPSPTVIGGGLVALVAVAAVAAGANNGEESSSAAVSAPAATTTASAGGVPAGASSDAGFEERLKDRQAWIAAWRAKN